MSTNHSTGVWYSPLSISEDSSETFGFDAKDAESRYERAARDIPHFIVGPMPVEKFLDEFMDRDRILAESNDMPSYEDAFSKVPEAGNGERAIYEPLIKALNEPNRCPGFTFHDTSDRPDTEHGRRGSLKPDICCFSLAHSRQVRVREGDKRPRKFMRYAALFFEVKESRKQDPFTDPPDDCTDRRKWKFVLGPTARSDRDLKEATKALGQNVTYAAEVFARQHRHCCYSVILSGSFARLVRWDRAGVIVTEAFDIRRYPRGLCEFIWCFAMIGDAGRGYDLTVELGNEGEKLLFGLAIEKHATSQQGPKDRVSVGEVVSRHFDREVVTVICVPDLGDGTVPGGVRRLLVSRPIVYPHSITGRATRSYWAVDMTTARVVFLKDTWRYDPAPSGRCEGDTLLHLHQHKVSNIPPLVCHGDVLVKERVMQKMHDGNWGLLLQDKAEYQSTRTQDYIDRPWVCGSNLPTRKVEVRVKKHTHYRLVLGVAGHQLTDFTGTSELLHAAHSVLKAIWGADKAKIVHRDLSPQNIILFNDSREDQDSSKEMHRTAYLVDWDLSWDTTLQLIKNFPYSASWQFVCIDVASGKALVVYTAAHDMESLLYVILYCALMWLPHTGSDSLDYVMNGMFDSKAINSGEPSGGWGKVMNSEDRRFTKDILWKSDAVGYWLNIIMDLHSPLTTPEDSTPYLNKWNPMDVESACETFFEEYTELPNGDRAVHLPKLDGREKNASRNITGKAFTATQTSSTPSKRDFESAFVSVPLHQSKKARHASVTSEPLGRSSLTGRDISLPVGNGAHQERAVPTAIASSSEHTAIAATCHSPSQVGGLQRGGAMKSASTSIGTLRVPLKTPTLSSQECQQQIPFISGTPGPRIRVWRHMSGNASGGTEPTSVPTLPLTSTAPSTISTIPRQAEAAGRSDRTTFTVPELPPQVWTAADGLNQERYWKRQVRDPKAGDGRAVG